MFREREHGIQFCAIHRAVLSQEYEQTRQDHEETRSAIEQIETRVEESERVTQSQLDELRSRLGQIAGKMTQLEGDVNREKVGVSAITLLIRSCSMLRVGKNDGAWFR